MRRGVLGFIRDQSKPAPPLVTADLVGKTVMVIGANTGLGFEACKHFARMNPARLILACRNEDKGKAAVERLVQETGFGGAELWLVDLSQFSSVIRFTEKFSKDGGRLDILVSNAGIVSRVFEATSDGWESTIQVNHLSTALLCLHLFPHMVRTARDYKTKSRLVIVSSDAHHNYSIDDSITGNPSILETFKGPHGPQLSRYFLSKLLNVFFTRAFAEHVPPTAGVIVNTVNPAFCKSELRRSLPFPWTLVEKLVVKLLAFTTEEGSRQLVWASVGGSEQESELHGAYIHFSRVTEPSDHVLSPQGKEVQARVWTETLDILTRVSPTTKTIVDEYLQTET